MSHTFESCLLDSEQEELELRACFYLSIYGKKQNLCAKDTVISAKRIGLSVSSKSIGLADTHSTHSLPLALIKQSKNKKKT